MSTEDTRSQANCDMHQRANLDKLDQKGLRAVQEAVLKAFMYPEDHERFEGDRVHLGPGERHGFARVTVLTTDWSICLEVQAMVHERDKS